MNSQRPCWSIRRTSQAVRHYLVMGVMVVCLPCDLEGSLTWWQPCIWSWTQENINVAKFIWCNDTSWYYVRICIRISISIYLYIYIYMCTYFHQRHCHRWGQQWELSEIWPTCCHLNSRFRSSLERAKLESDCRHLGPRRGGDEESWKLKGCCNGDDIHGRVMKRVIIHGSCNGNWFGYRLFCFILARFDSIAKIPKERFSCTEFKMELLGGHGVKRRREAFWGGVEFPGSSVADQNGLMFEFDSWICESYWEGSDLKHRYTGKTWATRDCQLPCLARKQWIQWDYWKRTSQTKKKRGKRCCQRAKCCSFMGFCSVLSQNIVGCNPVGASWSWLVDGMFEFNNSCILPAQLLTER